MLCLAWTRQILSILLFVQDNVISSQNMPKMHKCRQRGIVLEVINDRICIPHCPKFWTLRQSHIQWNKVSSTVHLIHVSGLLLLNWCNREIVIYKRIIHLYWMNFNLVLIIWHCASWHTFSSLPLKFIFKSLLHAIVSFSEDSLDLFTKIPYIQKILDHDPRGTLKQPFP